MSEFKIGDRVRIVNEDIYGKNRIGTICGKFLNYGNINRNLYEVDFGETFLYEIFEEDLELIENFKEPTSIEALEQRIEKLEKCVMGEQNLLEKCENVSSISEFTKEEIEAFNYWKDENYKWACKDETGSIHIFEIKPTIYNIEELLKG